MTELLAGVAERITNSYQNATGTTLTASTRVYLPGSALIPQQQLVPGSRFKWRFNVTLTAGAAVTDTIDIAFGSAGTVADTARVSFTKPAGTAVADEAIVEVEAVVISVSATGVVLGELKADHGLAATGFATIPVVVLKQASAGFPNDGSGQPTAGQPMIVGLCYTAGAAVAGVVNWVTAEFNLP